MPLLSTTPLIRIGIITLSTKEEIETNNRFSCMVDNIAYTLLPKRGWNISMKRLASPSPKGIKPSHLNFDINQEIEIMKYMPANDPKAAYNGLL
jgi:hypothetical protein